jgi:hypothetical protein
MPGVPVREIAVVKAVDDGAANDDMARLADRWPGFETIALYEGERLVSVLSDPAPSFASGQLKAPVRAA